MRRVDILDDFYGSNSWAINTYEPGQITDIQLHQTHIRRHAKHPSAKATQVAI